MLKPLMLKQTLARAYRLARIHRALRQIGDYKMMQANPLEELLKSEIGDLSPKLVGHLFSHRNSDGQSEEWIWNSRRAQFYNVYRAYASSLYGEHRKEAKAMFASFIRGQYRLSGRIPS